METRTTPTPTQAGWRIDEWVRLVGISRPMLYKLPLEQQPESVHVGRSRIIRESPARWLKRLAKQQRAAAPNSEAATA